MFIIWGTKTFTKIVGTTPRSYECPHCHNVQPCRIIRQTTWFTLFWIPIFPISVKRRVGCPICNYGRKIKKEEMQNLIDGSVG